MIVVKSLLNGKWVGETLHNSVPLLDAYHGTPVASVALPPADVAPALHFARDVGGKNLRKLTYFERAKILKNLAQKLLEVKEELYTLSYKTGATRRDSWIDIEGGIGNLFVMSSKAKKELPNMPYHMEGTVQLTSKNNTFHGAHLRVPRNGVAVHINAFNFPIWGMLEKFACNFLAGMPAIVKPATKSCFLTYHMVCLIDKMQLLPEGALSLLCGNVGNLLDSVNFQDVVTFTGSSETGLKLKSHSHLLSQNVPFNMEADSLNCTLLDPFATTSSISYQLLLKEVAQELTVKAGQKCTAIRRIIIPQTVAEQFARDLAASLKEVKAGDPSLKDTKIGTLIDASQLADVTSKVKQLKRVCDVLFESEIPQIGSFHPITLLLAKNNSHEVHDIEAFGPVATLIPYQTKEDAFQLAQKGQGSLVCSVVSEDLNFLREATLELAPTHGRVVALTAASAKESTGHGSPLPHLLHGGPGRAGGGSEMGGIMGLAPYQHTVSVQGHPDYLRTLFDSEIPGASAIDPKGVHPFRKYFEELTVGLKYFTHKRTLTESDIVQFSNLSWDHFYAHTDVTSLEGSLFEQRVAHGYLLLAVAAGLFVDPARGPVLANYGLEQFRFLKPVYAGTTLQVALTVFQKILKEPREGEVPSGVVKWQVDLTNQNQELVATGIILTLVAANGINPATQN